MTQPDDNTSPQHGTPEWCAMFYGRDAADWLARWDADKTVWSIEMGGLGPGYEQCIQITAAEIVRHLIASQYDVAQWKQDEPEQWNADREMIDEAMHTNPTVKELGLSGAQYGAAFSLALRLWDDGPAVALADSEVKDRLIQVSRTFPGAIHA